MNDVPVTQGAAAGAASAEQVDFDFLLGEREIRFDIDETLYPLDAIYGAAYIFIDRAYVFLTRPADKKVTVRLRTRDAADEKQLEALAGEFANELLNQALRVRIGESTVSIRDYYMARAFHATESRSTIDQLLAELDAEELATDSLEIPVPWEKSSG
jgi:His-Xaa-Ser system protein HxsD